MQTPTLTKKQAKLALSGKKKKVEIIKNVLAQPYEVYWPLITPEENTLIVNQLTKSLPRLKNAKVNIMYSQIKAVPKDERRKFRHNLTENQPLEISPLYLGNLIFGVNDVTKLIENQNAGAVLVAEDVSPRLLVQHVLDQCTLHKIPVLVVAQLRETLLTACGIKGAVFGLGQALKTDVVLGPLLHTIAEMWLKYQTPKNHINFNRTLEDMSAITILDSDLEEEHLIETNMSQPKNVYLRRTNKNTRVFVPEQSNTRADNSTFIALDTATFAQGPPKHEKPEFTYKALSVKRLKGDKNRNRRKIEKFKKKVPN